MNWTAEEILAIESKIDICIRHWNKQNPNWFKSVDVNEIRIENILNINNKYGLSVEEEELGIYCEIWKMKIKELKEMTIEWTNPNYPRLPSIFSDPGVGIKTGKPAWMEGLPKKRKHYFRRFLNWIENK